MDYYLKVTTGESITLQAAEKLERHSRELNLPPGELLAKFVEEGLQRIESKAKAETEEVPQ